MSRIALVHPISLLGKEVAERLAQRPALCSDLRLFAVDEAMVGTLTEGLDGAALVTRVDEGCFDTMDLTIFCGEIDLDRRAVALLPENGRAIMASPGAALADGRAAVAGIGEAAWLGQSRLLSPSPAAIGLIRLLAPLRACGLRRAVATVLLPASDRGAPGIDTLFAEARALLALAKPPKPTLFPAQIAFNLLPGQASGREIALQVESALGLSDAVFVQTAQAGVFHAVTLSLLVELAEEADAGADIGSLRKLLGRGAAAHLAKAPAALGPVEAAGGEDLLIGAVQPAGCGSFWIWAAIDNLTVGGADNVLHLAERLLGAAPAT